MKPISILILFLLPAIGFSQEKETTLPDTSATALEEVVISAVRFPEKKKNVVQKIDIISKSYINKVNAQNTGDLLQSTGNVFVQKSQQGGSSPVIRGFEASRILLVIDGIRMNNAIYRSGHLQNVITIDQNMLERAEVMYGPASTLYGSDALGGVVAFTTKAPPLSTTKGKLLTTGSAFGRYSTANFEKTGHANVSLGSTRFAVLLSGTYSYFDDLRMGANYPEKYPGFGRRSQYVYTQDGTDNIVSNDNDRMQRFSGYQQWDLMGKVLFKQTDRITHQLNVQGSNSTDIPRYDRLQDLRNGALRYANWYYGPQKRLLMAYDFNIAFRNMASFKFSANYQDIGESRHQRDRNNPGQLHRYEKVKVWAMHAGLKKFSGNHELTIGADMQLNDVQSRAHTENIQTGAIGKLDTRYPDGKNTFNNVGIYAQHVWKIIKDKLVLNEGLRLQSTWLHSTLVDTAIQFRLPFTELKQNPIGIAGNIGLAYMPLPGWRLTAAVTTGFRAPNIDDVAKVFESSTSARQLIVPNADLAPEKTINGELNIAKDFENKLKLNTSVFYTFFIDAIAYAATKYNGEDSVLYNGVRVGVKSSQNVAGARLWGYSAGLSFTPVAALEVYGNLNYTYGRYTRANGTKVPLDHISPLFGKAGVSFTKKKLFTEAFSLYNGWKRFENFNPDGEDNQQYATADGVPAWITLNWRLQFALTKNVTLQAALENITDRNYRVFASGFSAPGRNFLGSVRVTW